DFGVFGTTYYANFTSQDGLYGGNLNDDDVIDVLDFGVLIGQFGVNYGTPNTTCSTPFPHADINGDSIVGPADYTFVSTNFLRFREPDPCGNPLTSRGVTDISVLDLVNHQGGGWEMARTARSEEHTSELQ